MTISIIDSDFNLRAQIDDYESLTWVRRWHKPGSFELHINAKKNNVSELQKGRVVLHGTKAAFILHKEISISESGEEVVTVSGASVSSMLGRRITIPPEGKAYDRINSQIETIMKSYVNTNCINPVDIKRVLPGLTLAPDLGRGAKMVHQSRLKLLDEELEKLSIVSGLGWKVSLDLENERWVFDVYEGRDLTEGQEINPPVIFSVGFDSIKAQTFIDSELGHKNLAYVGGQGQGAERAIVKVGQELTGLERLETFIDARDIEDALDLPDRGAQKLAEMGKVLTFENEVLTNGPFVYGADWDLGDIVTATNKGWGVTLNERITEVTEVYEPGGFRLAATFGSMIPTLAEKIKQEMDMPLIENVTAASYDTYNIDGGKPGTNYGGLDPIVGGGV